MDGRGETRLQEKKNRSLLGAVWVGMVLYYSLNPGKLLASCAPSHFSSACCAPGETFRKRSPTCPLISAQATSASTSKGTLTSGSINFRRVVAPLGSASRNISAMPPSLTLVLEAFNSLLSLKMLTRIFH